MLCSFKNIRAKAKGRAAEIQETCPEMNAFMNHTMEKRPFTVSKSVAVVASGSETKKKANRDQKAVEAARSIESLDRSLAGAGLFQVVEQQDDQCTWFHIRPGRLVLLLDAAAGMGTCWDTKRVTADEVNLFRGWPAVVGSCRWLCRGCWKKASLPEQVRAKAVVSLAAIPSERLEVALFVSS